MKWNAVKDEEIDIPINTNVLISDGDEVFVGFYDSYHEWHLGDQTLCDSVDFNVTHWIGFPLPPV